MKITEEQLELAYLIAEYHNPLITEGGCDFRSYSREYDAHGLPEMRPSKLVIAILEDYQKKPRLVRNHRELDALPAFAVVRSATKRVFEKNCMFHNPSDFWWEETGTEGYQTSTAIDLPATVLFEGES